VWQAIRADGSSVALKFVPSDCQLAASQEVRALHALRQLKHDNLLTIDGIWSCPGYLVIVMELADGSLDDLLSVYDSELHTPLPPDHLCFFLRQAAEGIDFLNQRQHVIDGRRVAYRHCDIKPSNLLVVGSTVKLSDFSLAVQTTSPMWYCRRAGTLAYAAPEIFQGRLSDKSDQYSLAVTYYQMRTGKLPFPDTPNRFDARYVRPAPDLTLLLQAERGVLARALANVPQDRWPTCGEFIDRLQQSVVRSKNGALLQTTYY
jgi:serine/threonine protein kinase